MTTIKPTEAIKQRIMNGCYEPAENKRIYDKWFATGPRHQFQSVNRKYNLTDKVVCDIGCGYGMNIMYTHADSYGIEIDNYAASFARSIGLTIHERDFMNDDISDLPKVDAIWCSAVLEHVESVHIFLRKMAMLLKDDGLLGIFVPTIPLVPALRTIPPLKRFTTGYLYSDHINAFTPSTLRFFCERAGFDTYEVSPFFPPPLSIINQVPLLNRIVDSVTYVGRKIPDWDYVSGSARHAADNAKGFDYHDWFEDGGIK
ncbi:MAG: methyltransferase domain-containing protein [Phototrophicaceae bacterium]